jgi:CheY-like chemotaxis protein
MQFTDNNLRSVGVARTKGRVTRILLAEDDLEMRRLLAWALARNGYDVTECGDGMTVLRRLGLMDPQRTGSDYDLVISDVRMPGYDGLQVLESIHNATPHPPVVLISAFADEAVRERADRLGAARVIPKPFDVDELVAEVNRLLLTSAPNAAVRPARDPAPRPGFALEVTVRHGRLEEPVEEYIGHLACRLGRVPEVIRRCRVVIDNHDHDGTGGRHAEVKLIVEPRVGRTLVFGCNAGTGRDPESLYGALNTVFNTARRHLRARQARRRVPGVGGGTADGE